MNHLDYANVVLIASLIGGLAFAISGYLASVRKKLDLMGIFIVAFLTANGGGLVRDVIADRTPVILADTEPFWLTACAVLVASLLKLQRFDIEKRWLFIITDGIGLVAFGITGALIALEENLHFFAVLTLSLLTAVGGGMIRDLLLNEIPEVLHSGFYGSVALLLGLILYGLDYLALLTPLAIILAFAAGLFLRLFAYWKQWNLPKAVS